MCNFATNIKRPFCSWRIKSTKLYESLLIAIIYVEKSYIQNTGLSFPTSTPCMQQQSSVITPIPSKVKKCPKIERAKWELPSQRNHIIQNDTLYEHSISEIGSAHPILLRNFICYYDHRQIINNTNVGFPSSTLPFFILSIALCTLIYI